MSLKSFIARTMAKRILQRQYESTKEGFDSSRERFAKLLQWCDDRGYAIQVMILAMYPIPMRDYMVEQFYEVVDCEFNQYWYKDLIGQISDDTFGYAVVKVHQIVLE